MASDSDLEKNEKPQRSESDEDQDISVHGVETASDPDEIHRIDSAASRASKRSKLSRVLSKASRSSHKKENVAAIILPLSDLDKGIVGWESQDDPGMPLNYATSRKWIIVWAIAFITLMSPLSSSALAPAIESISEEFHNSDTTKGAFPVSIYLLGYAVGPLFLGPLSEIYGRAPVLTTSNIFFCLWHIGCALAPSLDSLIAFRFLSGVGGSGCLTLGGAIIGDLFPISQRGGALSVWTIGPLAGPSLGPLIGAFIVGSIGWRWAPWIVLIPSAIVTVILAIFLPETNHKVLIEQKTRRLCKEHSRDDLASCYETPESAALSQAAMLKAGFLRPLKMLALAPIVSLLSIYCSFLYGSIYLMYNSISPIFEDQYGFSTGLTGLVYVALGLGYMVGLWAFSMLSDRMVVSMTKSNDGVFEPEMRLPLIVYFAAISPITFFWYGWTAAEQVHWIVPIIGTFPLGLGIIGVFMPTQAYIIDAYPSFAASGIAAFTVLRSVVAAFLPLAGPALFASLGLGWGNSVLGFIAIALISIPVFIFKYGTRLRKKYPLDL